MSHSLSTTSLHSVMDQRDECVAGSNAIASGFQAVALASRDLLLANDFDAGLPQWLAAVGQSANADACSLYVRALHGATGRETMLISQEWRQALSGLPLAAASAQPELIDPTGADGTVEAMLRGVTLCMRTGDVAPGSSWRRILDSRGTQTVITAPIKVEGAVWGAVRFDFVRFREGTLEDIALLQTAADTLAGIVQRNRLQASDIAESGARLTEQRERARHLENTNASLAASMQALAEKATPDAIVRQILVEMLRPCASEAAGVFRIDWETRSTTDGIVLNQGQFLSAETNLEFASAPIDSVPDLPRLLACERPTVVILPQDASMLLPASLPFHRAHGYDALVIQTIAVAGRPQWILGLAGRDRSKLTPENLATFELMSHPLKLALELRRLGLENEKMAAERSRANENEHLAAMLQRVAADSRELIAAPPPQFGQALRAWLARLARPMRARRASYFEALGLEGNGPTGIRYLCEWADEAQPHHSLGSFDVPRVVVRQSDEAEVRLCLSGRVVMARSSELLHRDSTPPNAQADGSVVVVPVFRDGQQSGGLRFEYAGPHELGKAELAVLENAAGALGSVLERNLLGERLVNEQRQRVEQLERTHRILAASTLALAENVTTGSVVRHVVLEMMRPWASDSAGLWFVDEARRMFANGLVLEQGEFVSEAEGATFADISFDNVPDIDGLLACKVPTVLRLPQDRDRFYQDSLPFHAQRGHRAFVVQVLYVDERPKWLLGLAGRDESKLTPQNLSAFELISHHLKLALELKRAGEQAQAEAMQRAEHEARQQRERALLDERNRIARDVHDTLAQGFTGVSMQLEAARVALARNDAARAESHLQAANSLSRQSLAEARNSVYALRPEALAQSGLADALHEMVDRIETTTSAGALFEVRGWARPLPEAVEVALLRVAQEALANVSKHARASTVRVSLVFATDAVSLTVRDDGAGFDTARPRAGLGIAGMQERASELGASLLVASAPGAGTEIVFSIPT